MQYPKCVEGCFGLLLTNTKASVTPASCSQIRRGPGHNAIDLRKGQADFEGTIQILKEFRRGPLCACSDRVTMTHPRDLVWDVVLGRAGGMQP